MESKIQQLLELGASRATALSALKAARNDIAEASCLIFEDKHINAKIQDFEDAAPVSAQSMSVDSDTDDAGDQYDEDEGAEAVEDDCMFENDITIDNAYSGIEFDKNRKETVIEIAEPAEHREIELPDGSMVEAEILGRLKWMRGCPEGNEQSFFFSLHNELSEGNAKCKGCSSVIHKRDISDFFALPPDFEQYIERVAALVAPRCTKCGTSTCIVCGDASKATGTAAVTIDKKTGELPAVLLHCPDVAAVCLGIGLSYSEALWDSYNSTQSLDQHPGNDAPPHKKARIASEADGDEISVVDEDNSANNSVHSIREATNKNPRGKGYAGSVIEDHSGRRKAVDKQVRDDNRLAEVLKMARHFLPNRKRGVPTLADHMPAPTTLAHVRRKFNPLASLLLGSGSIADMADRSALYGEFLEWLKVLSSHEALCAIMGQPIMKATSVTFGTGSKSNEKTVLFESSDGPRELLERVKIQVKSVQRVLQSNMDSMPAVALQAWAPQDNSILMRDKREEARLGVFCEELLNAADAIDRYLSDNNGLVKLAAEEVVIEDTTGLTEEQCKERYEAWAKSKVFGYIDMEAPSPPVEPGMEVVQHWRHAYSTQARQATSHSARNTTIAKEQGILAGSLPTHWESCIFIRIDEGRPDLLKALITGPHDTPYANGMFMFDIFYPSGYDSKPPAVKTMTTNHGKFRYNPNLYADGKVCLSLLGTWQGPSWVPGTSTLLQVLVSIQSLILTDSPCGNEPGWESHVDTPESERYNVNVRRMVVEDAMYNMLTKPPEGFEDLIRTHYKLKRDCVLKQLDDWLAKDDGGPLEPGGAHPSPGHTSRAGGNDLAVKIQKLKDALNAL